MQIQQRDLPIKLPELGLSSSLLTRLYAARGVKYAAELEKGLAFLQPPHLLKGIDQAVVLLKKAILDNKRILIVGDFDADGATATSVGILGLQMLGATQLDYLVPNRFEYGYGLSPEIVEVALQRQSVPQVLLTVDNGISSVEGVYRAKQAGLEVIITDHHLPGEELPAADAIVNPNQPGCPFPSKALAGVGVMFYLLLALRTELRNSHYFAEKNIKEPNLAELLDLVALGTVADVVPLDANNRILVHQGINRIRAGRARPGLRGLLQVANKQAERISSMDLGFILGPRLNAAGRLEDMSIGIECLLCNDEALALDYAQELHSLNADRQAIEQGMQREALNDLKSLELDHIPYGLCLYNPDWHEGVVGIVASRLKERYHRPVIVFTKTENGSLKGSARSVNGFHIRDALDQIATANTGLITKFGGHAMAAGLSLPEAHYNAFSQAFDQAVRQQLTEADLAGNLLTDGELQPEEISTDMATALKQAGPWGQQFPEPLFHGTFELVNQRIVGEKHLKLVVKKADGTLLDAIAFNVDVNQWPNPNVRQVQLAYSLDINVFREKETLQLLVKHIEAA